MTIEEQLREYRATLDAATESAAASDDTRVAQPVHIRPARTLVLAAVAVAAAVAIAFAAAGASHDRSTRPAGTSPGLSTTVAPPTTIGPPSRTVVPDVVGMNTAKAGSTLARFGFVAAEHTITKCEAGPGLVAEEQPAPGTRVNRGAVITLQVCAHQNPLYVTLPVTVCATEYGVSPTESDPHAPQSLSVAPPPFASPRLSGYSDLRGFLPITGPPGWNCKAIEAGDGGQGVGVTPPGATPRDSWGVGGTVTQPPTDGVFALSDPACGGCVYGEVCSIVPGVDADFPAFAGTGLCHAAPAGETVTPLGNNVFSIVDPPGALGPDAAVSRLQYTPPTSTTSASVMRETCILPASQRAVCDALLDEFFALHP